jgi:hypothetical protein
LERTIRTLTASAPRYDARVVAAIRRLDDPALPIAETVRRLAHLADELGVPRPSYVHMRRYVAEYREREAAARARRQAIREILFEAYWDATTGKLVDAYELAERLKHAGSG